MKSLSGSGISLSRLGMGLMRLPEDGDGIDYAKAEKMIDALMEGGVNYYDSAWFYHGGGSEPFARRALTERYPCESFNLATKLPLTEKMQTKQDCRDTFEKQRQNLGVEKIDFYLLHGIGKNGWEHAKKTGAHEMQHELKAQGLIGHVGFSFHGAAAELAPILDEGNWDFVQLQINYADWSLGEAKIIYQEAFKRGVPIVVMEPVRGGGLSGLGGRAAEIVQGAGVSQAELALRWVASLPGVAVTLSGMSTLEQVTENVRIFSRELELSAAERDTTEQVVSEIRSMPVINCTDCRYCADCPQGIEIYKIFSFYNEYVRFKNTWPLQNLYWQIPEDKRPEACVACGACEKRCPQALNIIENLKMAQAKAVELKAEA